MGKFQLNKKGEDPIKIYEDTFKVANSTVETHLGKLGKMPIQLQEKDWQEMMKKLIQDIGVNQKIQYHKLETALIVVMM